MPGNIVFRAFAHPRVVVNNIAETTRVLQWFYESVAPVMPRDNRARAIEMLAVVAGDAEQRA